jgi:predicted nucleic acid-binding protein
MILVDSSVWIDYFRDADTPQVELLDRLLGRTHLAVGDLIIAEVLQGVRGAKEFQLVRETLACLVQIDLAGKTIAIKAAENFRLLRAKGLTVRKTIDVIIATHCIENNLPLLHCDPDFLPFAEHLGLIMVDAVAGLPSAADLP